MDDSDGYFFFVPSRSVWEEISNLVQLEKDLCPDEFIPIEGECIFKEFK